MLFNSLFRRRFYFGNADFTLVIGLGKKNALVNIFAKYLMGKTDNFHITLL